MLSNDPCFEVVGRVASGEAALAACQESPPDVLLLDLEMPGMPAEELIPLLPAVTKTIILTAHDSSAYVERIRKQNIQGYLLKCEVGLELIQAIRAVHQGAAWFTQRIALQMMGPGPEHPLAELSSRERQILQLLAQGLCNPAIGERLYLAEQTVRNYVSAVYDKLGLGGRVEAVVWMRERGLVHA